MPIFWKITVIDAISGTWYNDGMCLSRLLVGLLLVSTFLLACGQSVAGGDLDQQIADRTRQYQESLRQRANQLSPSFQAKVESQTQQTVAKGLEKWKKKEIDIQIALPHLSEARRIAQFLARHLPFSSSPAGSFAFGSGNLGTTLTITTGQHVLKPISIPIANLMANLSFVVGIRQSENIPSFFLQIVCTIVQRQ